MYVFFQIDIVTSIHPHLHAKAQLSVSINDHLKIILFKPRRETSNKLGINSISYQYCINNEYIIL